MFKFAQLNFSRRFAILNRIKKIGLVVNSSSAKFGFSTINNRHYALTLQNSSDYIDEMIGLNSSNMLSEFGAKKKSYENSHIAEEVIEPNSENITDKISKKSSPAKKTKLENTDKVISKPIKQSENQIMEKADKNAIKNKKGEKKTKTVSTIEEIENKIEGVVLFYF